VAKAQSEKTRPPSLFLSAATSCDVSRRGKQRKMGDKDKKFSYISVNLCAYLPDGSQVCLCHFEPE